MSATAGSVVPSSLAAAWPAAAGTGHEGSCCGRGTAPATCASFKLAEAGEETPLAEATGEAGVAGIAAGPCLLGHTLLF